MWELNVGSVLHGHEGKGDKGTAGEQSSVNRGYTSGRERPFAGQTKLHLSLK